MADSSVFLPYIIPTVAQRLGQPEITEPCEELRLSLVQLLTVLTEITKSKVGLYIDDLVRIMQRTVVDQFHEVKKVNRNDIFILEFVIIHSNNLIFTSTLATKIKTNKLFILNLECYWPCAWSCYSQWLCHILNHEYYFTILLETTGCMDKLNLISLYKVYLANMV